MAEGKKYLTIIIEKHNSIHKTINGKEYDKKNENIYKAILEIT